MTVALVAIACTVFLISGRDWGIMICSIKLNMVKGHEWQMPWETFKESYLFHKDAWKKTALKRKIKFKTFTFLSEEMDYI